MKRLILAAVMMLMVCGASLSIAAQNTKSPISTNSIGKNSISYASIEAFTDGRGVWVQWKTAVETKNLGFHIYRTNGGVRERLNPGLISGAYLQAQEERLTAGSYSFFDRFGDVNSTYVIESENLNGQLRDSYTVQTQLIEDLSRVAGISSNDLQNQALSSEPVMLQNSSILPKDLAAEVASGTARPNPTNQLYVAAQPGVKINVKKEGLYRVSADTLRNSGFDTNAAANLWQLYSNGVEQAINIAADGSYIEFYGKGVDTLDADTQPYYLLVGTQNGKRMNSVYRRRVGSSVTSENYNQTFAYRERFSYSQNYLNGDAENFFGTVTRNTGANINFTLSGVDFNSPTTRIEVTIAGLTQVSHQTTATLNGTELGVLSNSFGYGIDVKTFDVATSVLREGANTLQVKTGAASDITLFGGIKINFARRYRAVQNQISFYVPNYKASYVEGFTSPNVRVFDTTNADNPLLINGLNVETNNGTSRVYLPSNRGRVLLAVEDSAIMQPFSVVRNNPSTLSTTNHQADLVIITHGDWTAEANAWAAYRRMQGMSVEVVNIEDVFDEFNFGVLQPDAIRSFLQYAKANWSTPPNYVLLLGDATYDPKNYTGIGNFNFIPTKLVDTIYTETGSDDTLADFNDDGLAEIAIGRIPARNAASVTLVFNKIRTFELSVGQVQSRGALFASDLPNGYDFEGASNRLCDQLPSSIECSKVNRGQTNANSVLVGQLNTGKYLVNYAGHGTSGVWASVDFFSFAHAAELNNTNKSIFTLLTCLNGYFINSVDSLSEILLKNPNGGAVAAWASSGLTTPDVQEIMATRYYNQIGINGGITRMGDMVNDAKTTINFGRDVRLSWVLLGDPTMKVK